MRLLGWGGGKTPIFWSAKTQTQPYVFYETIPRIGTEKAPSDIPNCAKNMQFF